MSSLPPRDPFIFTVPMEGDDDALEKLMRKIERDRGFNCQFYKEKCLRRRLAVRMRARGQKSYDEYSALLDREPSEYDHLLDTLTINVTKFFRNMETWTAGEEQVFPGFFRLPGQLKVWSAGSSSGEEAHTVSILMREWCERNGCRKEMERVRITGTDIDRRSLETARNGVYPELSLTETPEPIRQRWFAREGASFRVSAEAKQGVQFVHRDLISGEPETEQSLIFCRNVVIYFDREIQERLFKRFYDALRPGGFLVLGKVETLIGPARMQFRALNYLVRIFQKPE